MTATNIHEDPHEKALQAFAKALAAFQAVVPMIPKGRTAKAGSFSYNYADLGDVLAAVRPVLSAHGLALIQGLGNAEDGRPTVTTILMHEGGHAERSTFAFNAQPDMQKLGGAITYARRYSCCAMLGVVAEDDDDAAHASAPVRANQRPKKVERYVMPPKKEASEEPSEAKRQPAKASEAQVKKLVVMCHKVNLTDDEVHAMLRGLYGDGVSSRKDLTKAQATALIDALTTLAEQGPESHRWDKINAAISKGQETDNGG